MIELPPQIFESFVPITAGIIVSLINKYIINGACCEPAPPEEIDSESDSDDTTKTELTDSVSRTSAITTRVCLRILFILSPTMFIIIHTSNPT